MSSVTTTLNVTADGNNSNNHSKITNNNKKPRCVVIVGAIGVGKSTLIQRFCIKEQKSKVNVANDGEPVTQRATAFTGPEGIELIDTVGASLEGNKSSVPFSMVDGKELHFILLLSSNRWKAERRQLLQSIAWAELRDNISVYAAYYAPFTRSDGLAHTSTQPPPDISTLETLTDLVYHPAPRREQAPAVPEPQSNNNVNCNSNSKGTPSNSKSKTKGKAQPEPPTKDQLWFPGLLVKNDSPMALLRQFWSDVKWGMPQQAKVMEAHHWKLLKSSGEISNGREIGEKLLEAHLHIMYPTESSFAINLADNESLAKVVKNIPELKAHVQDLYEGLNGPQQLNDEKFADYMEAFFFKLVTGTKLYRRLVVPFLSAITNKFASRQ